LEDGPYDASDFRAGANVDDEWGWDRGRCVRVGGSRRGRAPDGEDGEADEGEGE
jgi:hypothetical protein